VLLLLLLCFGHVRESAGPHAVGLDGVGLERREVHRGQVEVVEEVAAVVILVDLENFFFDLEFFFQKHCVCLLLHESLIHGCRSVGDAEVLGEVFEVGEGLVHDGIDVEVDVVVVDDATGCGEVEFVPDVVRWESGHCVQLLLT